MLRHLSIRDIVLIDCLEIALGPGLGVLTGETGAGKSILLDSLGLALGARGDLKLIRPGADKASVTAVFELSERPAAGALLRDHDIDLAGDDLVLRRTLSADGRGRAFVNDQPVSVGLLRALGDTLVEIQGQHELHGLLDPAAHLQLLDAFGGLTEAAADTAAAFRAWQSAEAEVAAAEAALAQARRDEELLRDAIAKLEALTPEPGEEARLQARRRLAQHAERLAAALTAATDQLAGEAGAERALQRALHELDRIADVAGEATESVAAALDRAAAEVGEAIRDLQTIVAATEIDPAEAEAVDDRLFALRAAARRHNVAVDELAAELDRLRDQCAAIETGAADLTRLAQACERAKRDYLTAAETLSKKRRTAARTLDEAVDAELAPLKLERAAFRTTVARVPEDKAGPSGLDTVRFEVRTNPGSPYGPVERVASGGELARFMLAIKVVMAASSPRRTLIFDEVDSGIGGATAAAVGERLARLAEDRQVLVVTHSPQVAAVGTMHLQVTKETDAKSARTAIATITDQARAEEIARMISGATITDEARAAAVELMKGAPNP